MFFHSLYTVSSSWPTLMEQIGAACRGHRSAGVNRAGIVDVHPVVLSLRQSLHRLTGHSTSLARVWIQ
jgi:hypothetical protein